LDKNSFESRSGIFFDITVGRSPGPKECIFYLPRLYPLKKYEVIGSNDSQDGMVFYLKLSQWYTKKEDDNTPKLIAV
jgi:hypothetical protein